ERLETCFLAPLRLYAQRAVVDGGMHAFGVALYDDIGDVLAAKLLRDGRADAPVAANDEMIGDVLEHTRLTPALQALGQAALDHHGREQREGVQGRADAGAQQHDREYLTARRQRRQVDGHDAEHRDVERVPES